MREQKHIQRKGREDLFGVCDKVYSSKIIAVHFYACYLGGILWLCDISFTFLVTCMKPSFLRYVK